MRNKLNSNLSAAKLDTAKQLAHRMIESEPICFVAVIKEAGLFHVVGGGKVDYLQNAKELRKPNVYYLMTTFGHGE